MLQQPPHILLVDGAASPDGTLALMLEAAGYAVRCATSVAAALSLIHAQAPQVIVVDRDTLAEDGAEVPYRLRRASAARIVILSSLAAEAEIIAALDCGADDYLVRPHSAAFLLARLRALLRRSAPPDAHPPLTAVEHTSLAIGPLNLDARTQTVLVAGDPLHLSRQEWLVLFRLAAHLDETQSYDSLIGTMGRETIGDQREKALRHLKTIVCNLRMRLGGAGEFLVNDRGRGYRLRAELRRLPCGERDVPEMVGFEARAVSLPAA